MTRAVPCHGVLCDAMPYLCHTYVMSCDIVMVLVYISSLVYYVFMVFEIYRRVL